MERVDCLVIGAGVVGLAAARALAQGGREVLIVDAAPSFGTGISARNSEVIHAGIYYPAASLKARLCVAGRRQLYAYCNRRAVAHRRCGKLIVATAPGQVDALMALRAAGERNGVEGLVMLGRDDARALEPALACHAALLSPETGIVDSHGLMQSLLADAEAAGAVCAFNCPVTGAQVLPDGVRVETGGADPFVLHARAVVNAAGLAAIAVARAMRGMAQDWLPEPRFAKGSYFALAGPAPFARLIYPVPEPGGLGVHLTLDLGGQAKFGPDVEWIDPAPAGAFDYRVDPARSERCYDAVRRYWPDLPAGALQPAYAGVRPKLHGPDAPAADFVVADARTHGVPGVVHLLGIESPGLTAALALGDLVAERLGASVQAA